MKRRRRSQRSHTDVTDRTRNSRRYLVVAYRDGRESVEANTPDQKRAHRIAEVTAQEGVLAVLHKHVMHDGWTPVRRFEPTGGEA